MRLAENGDPSTAIVCLTLFGGRSRHGQCGENHMVNVVP